MSRDEIQKLLGGYATGTLTAEEQQALFAAALDDQELFDTLAREQSLRDLLRDPAMKAQALAALDDRAKPKWILWWRPAAAGLAMAAVTVFAVIAIRRPRPAAEPSLSAVVKPAAPPPAPAEREAAQATEIRREAAPLKKKAARAVSAEKRMAEKDQLADSRDAGPAPPPPPVAEPVREMPAPMQVASGMGAARGRLSARTMFLNRAAQTQTFNKSQFVETAPRQTQAPAGQQQIQGQQDNTQFMKSIAPLSLGVRYSIVNTAGPQIRIETNDDGFLTVMARPAGGPWRVVRSAGVQGMQATLTTLRSDEKEVSITFANEAFATKSGPMPGVDTPGNIVEKENDVTYIVNPLTGPAGREVSFTIRLP
jgi:hypothetical protein